MENAAPCKPTLTYLEHLAMILDGVASWVHDANAALGFFARRGYRATVQLLCMSKLALVEDALEYVEACVGGPYVVWEGGRFTNSAPAWVAASSPPPAEVIRTNGGFCACIPTLMQRKAGIFDVDDTNAWYGGVLWYGEHYVDRLRVAEPFDINGDYGPGDLFIRRYTGPAVQGQGHVAVMSSDSMHLIQSDAFEGVPHPGINRMRTLRETEELLEQYDGGGFQWVVRVSNWLKPKGA